MTLQLGGPIPCWHVSPSLLLLLLLLFVFINIININKGVSLSKIFAPGPKENHQIAK